jgi:hypothetical protein
MTLEQYTNPQINPIEGLTNYPGRAHEHEIVFTIWTKNNASMDINRRKVYAITYVPEEDNCENDLQIAQRIIESFGMTR